MNTSNRTPAAALSPALLAAVAALASVASRCTGIRSAPASVQFLLPGVWSVHGKLAAALAEPTPAAFDALGATLARWCRIAGDAGMHRGDPAAFDLVMRAEDARERVRAAGIAARDGAAGLYDYDPEDRAGDAAVEAYLLSHAPDPSPAAEHDGAEVPDAPAGPTCEACGEQPPADGAAGLCFACGWDELAAPRPAPVEALDDHCDPWVPVRAAA